MYKYLFFIMLGINAVLFGVNLKQDKAQKTIEVIEVANDRTRTKNVASLKVIRLEGKRPVQRGAVDEVDHRIKDIKDKLFRQQRMEISYRYSFLFDHNDLHPNDFERVTEILQEKELKSYGCLGTGIDNRKALGEILTANFSPDVSARVLDMLDKQYAYESVCRLFDYEIENIRDVKALVDELYSYHSELQFTGGLGIDPFAGEDPFAEADPFAEEDPFAEAAPFADDEADTLGGEALEEEAEIDHELAEILERKRILLELNNALDELNEEQKKFLDSYMDTLSQFVDLSDRLKLKVISELF